MRQTDRQRQTDRDRQTETDRDRQRQRQKQYTEIFRERGGWGVVILTLPIAGKLPPSANTQNLVFTAGKYCPYSNTANDISVANPRNIGSDLTAVSILFQSARWPYSVHAGF